MNKTDINKIFKVVTDKQKIICPPEQVFVRPEFDFLLTIGGDLVEDENEYDKFRTLLKNLGEIEFYIFENLGATITDRNTPFQTTINLIDDYKIFREKVSAFESPFGWTINHFFIYGQNENWGIYICEYPTINIIGCDNNLSDKFRQVFSIRENGYNDLKEFIKQEYDSNPNLMREFISQYRFENDTDEK